ncbi:MAG: metallophosphoesterase family protein, partial [Fimbriiglobus sp.]
DGLVFSGDATAFGFESELTATAAVLGVGDETLPPAVAVPGNHDYYTDRAVREGTFERIFAPWQQGVRMGPDPYPFARKLGGVWVVALNTATVNRWHWDASGAAGEVQLRNLRTLCAGLSPGPRVLVTHYPLRTARGTVETRVHRLRDHEAVRTAAVDCNISLWLHGHIHRGFLLSPSPTIPFALLNPGSATQNNRWTYHEYQIGDGQVGVLRREYEPNTRTFHDAEFREIPMPM